MSAIFRCFRVCRSTFPSKTLCSRNFFLRHQLKWCHGLPGIPNDEKVVRLRNSGTGSDVYLIGTCHISNKSAETVKKVIDLVMPDAVAVELCGKRAFSLLHRKPENSSYKMVINSMKVRGGLKVKIATLCINIWYRRLRARGIIPGKEFKVAIEESQRSKAKLYYIDEDVQVLYAKISKILSFDFIRRLFGSRNLLDNFEKSYIHFEADYLTRSAVRKITDAVRQVCPEIATVLITERDLLMAARLRRIRGSVVAVVGLGHMDGIEKNWEKMEDCIKDEQKHAND